MLIFDYSKNYNKFFFVSNLAEWHFSCRKKYNEIWLKNNPLNREEAAILGKIRLIFQKYGFGENYPGLAFFGEEVSWDRLKKKPSKRDLKIIRESFRIFSRRFNDVWRKELYGLRFWKKELKKEMNQADNQRSLAIFKKFLNSQRQKIIKTYLLISPPKGGLGGQAVTGKNIVTLDCSGAFRKDKKRVISILMHEIIHIFQRDYFEPLVDDFIKNNRLMDSYPRRWPELYKQKWGPKSLFKETLASCLPRVNFGISSRKMPKTKNTSSKRPKIIWEALDYSIRMNQSSIEGYLLAGKIIDKNLLEMIWRNFELSSKRGK